ncbi:hypothetical protein CS542_03010 [Pedobacter sp. IW39]|nr:hypothetical protein CS542_03010 [Pedobacter sp. IW39]
MWLKVLNGQTTSAALANAFDYKNDTPVIYLLTQLIQPTPAQELCVAPHNAGIAYPAPGTKYITMAKYTKQMVRKS